jgi:hypothetical protein
MFPELGVEGGGGGDGELDLSGVTCLRGVGGGGLERASATTLAFPAT